MHVLEACQCLGTCVGCAMAARRTCAVRPRPAAGASPPPDARNTPTHFHWFRYCTASTTNMPYSKSTSPFGKADRVIEIYLLLHVRTAASSPDEASSVPQVFQPTRHTHEAWSSNAAITSLRNRTPPEHSLEISKN